jgi:hypothetical protein
MFYSTHNGIGELDLLSSAAPFGKPSETSLRCLILAALELGMSPRSVVDFCIYNGMWDLIAECFQFGFRVDQRLDRGDTIFVALCATDTPTRIITYIFDTYLDQPIEGVEFVSDLLLDGSGNSVLITAAGSDLSVVNFVWLLERVERYGVDVNTRGRDGCTALDALCKSSNIFEYQSDARFIRAKTRILVDRGSKIDSIMPSVSGSVLFELLNMFLEGKISLLEQPLEYDSPLLCRIAVCDVKLQNLVGMDRLLTVPDALSRLLHQADAEYGQERVIRMIMERPTHGYATSNVIEECLLASEFYEGSWDSLCAPRIKAICAVVKSKEQRSKLVNYETSQKEMPPLLRAASASYHRVMEQLIHAGANVNALFKGDSALALVLTSFQPRTEILQAVRILLVHGADPTSPSVVLNGLPPLHWILRFLGTRGIVVATDASDSEDDGGVRGVRAEMRDRRRRRNSRNQLISVESDYDSDSAEESIEEFDAAAEPNISAEENDIIEWKFEDEMVQIAHLLLESTPVHYLNKQLEEGPIKKYPLAFLGDMCDRGEDSAAIALLHSMLKLGLDLALPAHRDILKSWRHKRSKLGLLSSISASRKMNSNKKQANTSKPTRGRSYGLFQEDEDDDDGFQHWL